MKNLFKIIFLSLLINNFAFAEVEIKIKYESEDINRLLSERIIYNIKSNIKNINFDHESFYLKGTCYINSNGKLIYKLNKESNGGYNNKVLIVEKLEEIKRRGFKEDRETINNMNKDYNYKDIIFSFEAIQE